MNRKIQQGWTVALTAVMLSVCVAAQSSQEKGSIDPLAGLNSSLERLTTKISPAVVHIEVAGYGSSDNEDDDNKNQILTKEHGSGSGVILDRDGYIVTAYHVIEGAKRVRVELAIGNPAMTAGDQSDEYKPRIVLDGKVVGVFKDADVAVLKIDKKNLPTISFSGDDSLKQGQLVAALGSPEGLRNSLSLGVVSAVSRQIEPDDFMTYLQTDAAQAPGSSGGPLVNIQGEMVGIVVFSLTDRGKHEGLGFAVPSAMVRLIYDQIREFGVVQRGYLGAEIQGITPILASALQLPIDSGVIVAGADTRFAEKENTLQTGDVLINFNGTRVRNVPQLNWALLHKKPGDHASVEVWRKSKRVALEMSLVGPPPDSLDSLATIKIEDNVVSQLGIVGSVLKHEANSPATGGSRSGVLVMARLRGTDTQAELAVGDVIRSINTVPITSVAQLRGILDGFKQGDAVALQVERKGKPMYVAFEMD